MISATEKGGHPRPECGQMGRSIAGQRITWRATRRVTWGSTEKESLRRKDPDLLAETQGFEPWMQLFGRMLP
jgi:hypothetical protein